MNRLQKHPGMTVAQLMELLKAMPPDAKVIVRGYENGYDDIQAAEKLDVQHKQPYLLYGRLFYPEWYDGTYEKAEGEGVEPISAVYLREVLPKNKVNPDR